MSSSRPAARFLRWVSVQVFTCVSLIAGEHAPDNVVLRWNAALLDAIRAETTPPPLAARNLALLHLALDAALAPASLTMAASVDAAAADSVDAAETAARTVCEALYPGQTGRFRIVGDTPARLARAATAGDQAGEAIAHEILAACADDGASRSVTYIPEDAPGRWRRTPPFFRPPELPQWPQVRSFTDSAALDTTVAALPGPPAPGSPAFVAALAEVDRLGRFDSPERTPEQAKVARFWSDFSYTTTPPGHWNLIAAQVVRARDLDVVASARLFRLLNVAMADAAIACWRAKYRFNAWRPITAHNHGSPDAGSVHPRWRSFLPTPAHPEYPSGHSVFSGAAAEVLTDFCGTDAVAFTVTSDALPGVTLAYPGFAAVATEIGRSRVYAGIHFTYACEDGLVLGREVGRLVLRSSQP